MPLKISMHSMMRRFLWINGLLLVATLALGQSGIGTFNGFTAEHLIKEIFATGACDNIDSIATIGEMEGIGYFEDGLSSIGLGEGIILSTGPTHHAQGPNQAAGRSGDLPGNTMDDDLAQLTGGQVFDAVGIEFDFIPLDSILRFRYVFASEEYCEFVGSNFNDVFGFFVSGPGFNGPFSDNAENVALIPNTNNFVAINSVNHVQNSNYYVHNETQEDIDECNLGNISTPNLGKIEFDGFTTVLYAELRVQPCQKYHIRLVLGDVGDPYYDSAVFLEAGSFNLGGFVALDVVGETTVAGEMYEGCETAAFRFSRTEDSPLDVPLWVNYNLGAASTATPNVDFDALPGQVMIPAGTPYVDVPVNSIPDGLTENDELLRLVLDIPCGCYSDSADVYIVAPPPMNVDLADIYLCPDEDTTVEVVAEGGVLPYTYNWSLGSTDATQTIMAGSTTPVTVTVNDACWQEETVTAQIFQSTPPTALLSGTDQICNGETAFFPLTLTGNPPFTLDYLLNGVANTLTLNEASDFPASVDGIYELVGVRDAGCAGDAQGQATLEVWDVDVDTELRDVICAGENTGSIEIIPTLGLPPFTFDWADGPQQADRTNLFAGTYELLLSDARGCEGLFTYQINEPPPLKAPVVECDSLFTDYLALTATGGIAPYAYRYSPTDEWLTNTYWANGMQAGEWYPLTIRDASGCELAINWLMPATYPDGMAWLPEILEEPLGITTPLIWESYVPPSLLSGLRWQPANQLSCEDCLDPLLTAIDEQTISLRITDYFGCSQNFTTALVVDDRIDAYIPNAFSPNGDNQNDLWSIFGNPYQIESIAEIRIFDRWGNYIFQATNWPINSDAHGWDGTWRDELLDNGIYVYVIRFRLVNGQERTLGGDVLLLR